MLKCCGACSHHTAYLGKKTAAHACFAACRGIVGHTAHLFKRAQPLREQGLVAYALQLGSRHLGREEDVGRLVLGPRVPVLQHALHRGVGGGDEVDARLGAHGLALLADVLDHCRAGDLLCRGRFHEFACSADALRLWGPQRGVAAQLVESSWACLMCKNSTSAGPVCGNEQTFKNVTLCCAVLPC